MSATHAAPRNPLVAVALSLFATGLGHIYCGRVVAGLVLFLASAMFAPIIVGAALLRPSTAVLAGLLLTVLAVLGLYLFAVVDAYRLARRCPPDYEPKEYNRGVVYALFILVGLTYPIGVAHYLRGNIFEAFLIPTASEVPNLIPGDRVLVNKTTYHQRFPHRGDTVVFRVPSEPGRNWVKRVIGLPGDTVAVRKNEVFINGKKLERDRVPAAGLAAIEEALGGGEVYEESNAGSRYMILLAPAEEKVPDYPETKVPEGACFVLGDNRNHSRDSRHFGFVLLGEVLGTVQYVYLPAQTWSRFGAFAD